MIRKKALVIIAWCLFCLSAESQEKTHSFAFSKDEFLLDDKPFQMISGEMHPARIPVEYWRHRIQMAKAMGCNTIAVYVFWNYQESNPGIFDFTTGNYNINKFIRMVQEEGLWLILRPGPYGCAEWDFGGLPSYLLGIPDIRIRCMDPRYTEAAERYVSKLALQVKDLQVTKGGPLLMVQVENEYGSYGNDRNYMRWLKELWQENGIEVPFFTADGPTPHMLGAGTLSDVAIGLDPGTNESHFAEAARENPNVPSFCSELYPGWITHWGESWQQPDTTVLLRNVRWLMDHGKSFNFYVIHGGTNFGFRAGANVTGSLRYQPDVTSYDYDAPINEMGQATPKYYALRNLLLKYLPKNAKPVPVPAANPVIEIPEIPMALTAPIWTNLPEAIRSVQPRPMEMYDQKAGFILYRTRLIGREKGTLRITQLHDYATVFLEGEYVGSIDRSKGENTIELPASSVSNPLLDILVEGMGRVNFGEYMLDRKGITDHVSLGGMTLMNWDVFPLPMDSDYIQDLAFESDPHTRAGLFFKGSFHLDTTGDTYMDVSEWEKGVIWVNGHNLGRYWKAGPQKRLYCPAPWFKKGTNEIVVFDLHRVEPGTIKGVKSLY